MKVLALLIATFALLACGSAQAQQYVAPWCAQLNMGPAGAYMDCRYPSIETCRRNVLAGNRGYCVQNPAYVPAPKRTKVRRTY
jgi:hypothetical protein